MEDKEQHYIKGKWVDCKEAILRHEMVEALNSTKAAHNKQSSHPKNPKKNQTFGKYTAQEEFEEEDEYQFNQEKGTYERISSYNSSKEAKNSVMINKGRNTREGQATPHSRTPIGSEDRAGFKDYHKHRLGNHPQTDQEHFKKASQNEYEEESSEEAKEHSLEESQESQDKEKDKRRSRNETKHSPTEGTSRPEKGTRGREDYHPSQGNYWPDPPSYNSHGFYPGDRYPPGPHLDPLQNTVRFPHDPTANPHRPYQYAQTPQKLLPRGQGPSPQFLPNNQYPYPAFPFDPRLRNYHPYPPPAQNIQNPAWDPSLHIPVNDASTYMGPNLSRHHFYRQDPLYQQQNYQQFNAYADYSEHYSQERDYEESPQIVSDDSCYPHPNNIWPPHLSHGSQSLSQNQKLSQASRSSPSRGDASDLSRQNATDQNINKLANNEHCKLRLPDLELDSPINKVDTQTKMKLNIDLDSPVNDNDNDYDCYDFKVKTPHDLMNSNNAGFYTPQNSNFTNRLQQKLPSNHQAPENKVYFTPKQATINRNATTKQTGFTALYQRIVSNDSNI